MTLLLKFWLIRFRRVRQSGTGRALGLKEVRRG